MRRWRELQAKPGQLRAGYGKVRGDSPDLLYAWGAGGASKSDGRLVCAALEEVPVFEGRALREELEVRGYDITTLRFSIQLKALSPTSKESSVSDDLRGGG